MRFVLIMKISWMILIHLQNNIDVSDVFNVSEVPFMVVLGCAVALGHFIVITSKLSFKIN